MTFPRKRILVAFVAGVLAWGAGLLLPWIRGGNHLEEAARRVLILAGLQAGPGRSDIVLLTVDEPTFRALRTDPDLSRHRLLHWPFPPTLYAEVIKILSKYKVDRLGLDLLFSEPFDGLYLPEYASSGAFLEAMHGSALPVVLAGMRDGAELVRPLEPYLEGGCPWGLINVPSTAGGRICQYDFQQGGVDSFALALARAEGGDRDLAVNGWTPELLQTRQWLSFPRPADRAFPVLSLADLLAERLPIGLRDAWRKNSLAELLEGKTVLLGLTSLEGQDHHPTPLGVMPGVVLHAFALQMLQGPAESRIREVSAAGGATVLATILCLAGVLSLRLSGVRWWLAIAGLGTAYGGLAAWAFRGSHLILPLTGVAWSIALFAWIQGQLMSRVLGEEKRFLEGVFGKYVSPQVAATLLENPDLIRLGGEERGITILFSDIAGFTSLSEKLEPPELLRVLNGFLGALTREVMDRGGTLDKYIGDAIMAFWGAPVADPDQAARACEAALAMQRAAVALGREASGSVPALHCRIGINTGTAVVGNAGSTERFSYTAIGDAVNTASRLESLGKKYGVSIIIGESTWIQVRDRFATRLLDRVRVKGKTEPTAIYELLDPGEAADPERRERHSQAMAAYFAKDLPLALRLFTELRGHPAEATIANLFLARIRSLQADPALLERFDGTWTMEEK